MAITSQRKEERERSKMEFIELDLIGKAKEMFILQLDRDK